MLGTQKSYLFHTCVHATIIFPMLTYIFNWGSNQNFKICFFSMEIGPLSPSCVRARNRFCGHAFFKSPSMRLKGKTTQKSWDLIWGTNVGLLPLMTMHARKIYCVRAPILNGGSNSNCRPLTSSTYDAGDWEPKLYICTVFMRSGFMGDPFNRIRCVRD